ncbi:barstar family protein [Amycolatopsis sp.]|jgi:RNAse (barnase) inhibitor barstar|uniref:barstar family protein n=1 Tax=Amycolatopsis sp. TaxID=37632 RepID=UPI002DFBBD1B|nr:barstar family protein [Amycolatopsis sp.]
MTGAQPPTATALAAKARARGAFVHLLDGKTMTDKASTLDAIAAALSFPATFGKNLDALYDCLTDLSWLPAGEHVLIWVDSDLLKQAEPRTYLSIRSVLSDAQRALAPGDSGRRHLTVLLADS